MVAISLLALMTIPATSQGKTPTGDFAGFSQCPRFTTGVELCLLAPVTGGEISVGKIALPISKTLLLQGGIIINQQTFAETFVGAINGQTLSRTPLPVPGGLVGVLNPGSLPGALQMSYVHEAGTGGTGVAAITELVGTPTIDTSSLETREGTVMSLPVRIKLENPLLGGECYIGSRALPVTLNLTAGETAPARPNKPIEGRSGFIRAKDEFELIEITNDLLVDNAFSVPRATGCGGSFSSTLDPAIDAKLGLPAAAGINTAIFHDTLDEATTVGVIASER